MDKFLLLFLVYVSSMHNLANTLGEQGQLDQAAKMKKKVLEKRRCILGKEHPDTISATALHQCRLFGFVRSLRTVFTLPTRVA